MTLGEVSALHDAAIRVTLDGFTIESVDFPPAEDLLGALMEFGRQLRRAELANEPWSTLQSLGMFIHAGLLRTPVAPCVLYAEFQDRFNQVKPIINYQLPMLPSNVRDSAESVVKALAAIKSLEINPVTGLVNTLLDEADAARKRAIIATKPRSLEDELAEALHLSVRPIQHRVLRPSELRAHPPADMLIIFGPPRQLEPRGEEHLLRAPIAPEAKVVAFAHQDPGEILDGRLEGPKPLRYTCKSVSESSPTSDFELDMVTRLNPRQFRTKNGQQIAPDETGLETALTEAKRFVLGSNRGVYLAAHGHAYKVMHRRVAGNLECCGIDWCNVAELEAGDLIVLTTDGSGDMIKPYADQIIGKNSEKYRGLQARWKRDLRALVERHGYTEVTRILKANGSKIASPANIRNWCGPFNIAPGNLERDFNAILKAIKLSPAAAEYHTAATQIRSAHQSAGMQLQNTLMESLKGQQIAKVFSDGSLTVRAKDGGPSKTIFLVENIIPGCCEVPAHYIAKALELEDDDI